MHNFHVLEMTSLTWIIQNYVNNPSFKWIWQIHFYEITIFNHLNTSNHLWTLNITRIKSEWVFSGRVSYTSVTALGQLDHEYPVSKVIWGHVMEFNPFCSRSLMTQFWITSIILIRIPTVKLKIPKKHFWNPNPELLFHLSYSFWP